MTDRTPKTIAYRAKRVLPLAAGLLFATAPALAQGTPEQREACAPDAVKLCPDTIPDEGRTAACMRRKEAQLSPRCRAVFDDAVRGLETAAQEPRRTARAAPDRDLDPPPRPRTDAAPDAAASEESSDAEDVARARAVIGRLCRHDVLDPGTCAVTRNALDLAR